MQAYLCNRTPDYLYRATAKNVGSVWLCTHTRSLKGDSGLGWVLGMLRSPRAF